MLAKMRVSIVIPTYNGADTLHDQLDSITRQSIEPDEVLIADNGSTDDSRAVAERFSDRLPIRIVDAAARRGNAPARNLGAAASSGDIILFLDQDDQLADGWLISMIKSLKEADVVVGVNEIIFDWPPRKPSKPTPPDSVDFLPYGLSCNMGITKESFDELGGFDEAYQSATDVDLCWRSQLLGLRFAIVPEALVYKRPKATTRAVFRQHTEFGWDDVLLYQRFRAAGRNRSRPIRCYAWLATRSPLLYQPRVRRSWVRLAGKCWGRFKGSVAMRVRNF